MRMNNKTRHKKKDTNENQFRSWKIELNLLHEAEMEGVRRNKKHCFSSSDLLNWEKDTFHVTLRSFIDVINIQLSFTLRYFPYLTSFEVSWLPFL